MTLEEAIRHAEEKAKCGGECGEDHAQLAEWLKELRERRAAEPEKHTEERTETHACDPIDRWAALDCVSNSLVAWEAYEAIEALPAAEPEPQWIPCVERLPEGNLYVLVTYKYQYGLMDIGITWYSERENKWCDVRPIIAWMPLPKPYGGEQDGSD